MSKIKIIKPNNDDRDYGYMTLNNGLGALLISDKTSKTAAASLCVKIGYYADPEDTEGLAHFLEHMLFQGSKKYPETDTYHSFINDHGGVTNAYTGNEITNYHFDIVSEQFPKALDMFSRFFIDPLFNENNVFKEMNAVNSEHSKNLNSDAWRGLRIIQNMASKKHPSHKYGCGTLET